jgi:hypothetical protein
MPLPSSERPEPSTGGVKSRWIEGRTALGRRARGVLASNSPTSPTRWTLNDFQEDTMSTAQLGQWT